MAKLLHLKEFADFEDARSGRIISENDAQRTAEPSTFPKAERFVDELTLWTIAKLIENGEKNSTSK